MNIASGQAQQNIPVILAFVERLRQKDHEFEATWPKLLMTRRMTLFKTQTHNSNGRKLKKEMRNYIRGTMVHSDNPITQEPKAEISLLQGQTVYQ